MNIENELKLLPKRKLAKEQIFNALEKKGYVRQGESKEVHQEDTYFDDELGSLEKKGESFRVRRIGDDFQITYKAPVESDTEYKQREEYEVAVPKEYFAEGQVIQPEEMVELFKYEYPYIELPENIKRMFTIINNRNITNLSCQDGTIVEMAMDSLTTVDNKGRLYAINPELEFEVKSGNDSNLNQISDALNARFPEQLERNNLSKYARTKKEVEEKKLTIGEISICAMFSEILKSEEFSKLRRKGQIVHLYDQETLPNLDNFKEFDYLVQKMAEIKRGEYKVPENPNVKDMNLEDMFCILLSSTDYKKTDEILGEFLNEHYYADERAMTNRLSHSQQVMLATGLTCKSMQVDASFEDQLTAMVAALSHDIGHVPLSHLMEGLIADKIGRFTHDENGKNVLRNIFKNSKKRIKANVYKVLTDEGMENLQKNIIKTLISKEDEVETAVAGHSRKNSLKRDEGIVAQGARLADKTQYVVSDIRDLRKYITEKNIKGASEIMDKDWIEETIRKICAKKTFEYDGVKAKIYESFINPIQEGNYGRAALNTINSIRANSDGEKVQYDVDNDLWEFINATIKKTAITREEAGIDQYREKWRKLGEVLLTNLVQGKNEKDKAALLRDVTKMDEFDLIEYLKSLMVVSYKQVKGEEKITPEDFGNIRKAVEKLREDVDTTKMTDEEVLQFYLKSIDVVPEKGLDKLEHIKDRADNQLKIDLEHSTVGSGEDTRPLTVDDVLIALEVPRNGIDKIVTDLYYKSISKNLTIRESTIKEGKQVEKQIIITQNPDRQKTKATKRTAFRKTVDTEATIEQELEIIRKENPELKVGLESPKPVRGAVGQGTTYTKTDKKRKKVLEVRDYRWIDVKKEKSEQIEQLEVVGTQAEVSKAEKILQKLFPGIKFTHKTKEQKLSELEEIINNAADEERE